MSESTFKAADLEICAPGAWNCDLSSSRAYFRKVQELTLGLWEICASEARNSDLNEYSGHAR
jgi:hypothetical protein